MASRPLLITIIGALYALLGIVMLALGALTFAGGAVGGEAAAGAVGGGTVAVIGLIYIIIALGFLKGWKLWWYLGVIFAMDWWLSSSTSSSSGTCSGTTSRRSSLTESKRPSGQLPFLKF